MTSLTKIGKFGDAEKKRGNPEGLMGLSVGQAAGTDCGAEKSEPWGQDCKSGSRFPSSDTKLSHQTLHEWSPEGPVQEPRFFYYRTPVMAQTNH